MHKLVKAVAPVRPEIRLKQAISEFESDLHDDQRAQFHDLRSNSIKAPPTPQDVMAFTAVINRSFANRPVVGSRLMRILETAQRFASLGDVLIGGSQNLIACGVWTLVRMTITAMTTVSSYAENLSMLFLKIGRSAPHLEGMVLIYHQSKRLQTSLCEYFTVVVHLCHDVLKFTQRSHLARIGLSLVDSSLPKYQEDLDSLGVSIRDQIIVLQSERAEEQARINSEFRNQSASFWQLSSAQRKLQARQRVLDFCSQYDHAATWRQIRKMGKTNLFSQCIEYNAWKTNMKGKTLFFVGKLGSGKSVLLANLLDDLNLHLAQNDSCSVAFFFCRHDIAESLNPRVIIGSIARQILSQVANAETAVELVENAHDLDPFMVICDIMKRVLPSGYRPFLVMDGLDELDASERETLVENLKRFQRSFGLSICISVRQNPANWLKSVSGRFLDPVVVPMPDNKSEIELFIKETLENDPRIAVGDPALIPEIQSVLVKGSQGMFLWVALQIDALRAMESDHAIRQALRDLPKDLSEIFSRALQRSRKCSPNLQDKILSLITVAQRPLSPEEMCLALSIVPGKPVWDRARLPNNIYTGLDSCGSLVIFDEDELTLHLVHHSVKQWLISDSSKDADVLTIRVESAHEELTHKLVTYLNYSEFENQVGRQVVPYVRSGQAMNAIISATLSAARGPNRVLARRLRSNSTGGFNIGQYLAEAQKHSPSETISALHDYASKYWTVHLPWCFPLPTGIHTLFENLCSREGLASSKRGKVLLGLATRHQSMALIQYLVESLDVDINSRVDDRNRTALHVASSHAFESAVAKIVDFHGIDVTLQDNSSQSPISIALQGYLRFTAAALGSKFLSIIKILVSTGQISHMNTPLFPVIRDLATYRLQSPIVPLLDAFSAIKDGEEIWHIIEEMVPTGNDGIFRLLVEHKSTPALESAAAHQYFPLHLAILNRRMSKIEILIGSGKVSSWQVDRSNQTPFHLAAAQGNLELLKVLLYGRKNLDTIPEPLFAGSRSSHLIPAVFLERAPFPIAPMGHNERDIHGNTALHIAVKFSHKEGVELILSLPKTDVNVSNCECMTPLHMAAKSGHDEIFSLIFTHSRRSMATVDSFQNVPLHSAAAAGHTGIVAVLLEDCPFDMVNDKNHEKHTPLQLAAMGGHVSAMKLLLAKRDIDLDAIDGVYGQSALHHAVLSASHEAVELLLQKGADPWISDRDKCTPLHLATKKGYTAVVELLVIKENAALDRIDALDQTALHYAVLSNNHEAVKLLLQKSTNLWVSGSGKRTILYITIRKGYISIIKLLITKYNTTLDYINLLGNTTLYYTILSNNYKVVKLLLYNSANL